MNSAEKSAMILGLIRLQEIDDEVQRVERRLREGPLLLEKRAQGLRELEAREQQYKDTIKSIKAEAGRFELDLRSKETEIQKIVTQQGSVRTNQEYRAFGEHIDRIKKQCGELEDQILLLMSKVEAEQENEKRVLERMEDLRKDFKGQQDRWSADETEYRAELQEIAARREIHSRSLAEGPLKIYQRVLKAREGKAVVPVENRVCAGCRMTVTPNDLARLHRGRELVTCKSCERILFLP